MQEIEKLDYIISEYKRKYERKIYWIFLKFAEVYIKGSACEKCSYKPAGSNKCKCIYKECAERIKQIIYEPLDG